MTENKIMKALIVGLGSMGKRRIRLLKGIDPTIEIIGVDTWDERRKQVEDMGHKTFGSIAEAAAEKPDVAFVCTAPLSHYAILKELLTVRSYRGEFFPEKLFFTKGGCPHYFIGFFDVIRQNIFIGCKNALIPRKRDVTK